MRGAAGGMAARRRRSVSVGSTAAEIAHRFYVEVGRRPEVVALLIKAAHVLNLFLRIQREAREGKYPADFVEFVRVVLEVEGESVQTAIRETLIGDPNLKAMMEQVLATYESRDGVRGRVECKVDGPMGTGGSLD